MRTPVLTTTSTHPFPFSPITSDASGEIVVPRSSSRVQSPIPPYSSFLNPRQPLFVSAGTTVVHRHSLPPLFFKCRSLGRSHCSPINHYSTSALHSTHLLARHGYCVHMRSPLVCIASVQCFGRRQGEDRISRVAITIVDYYLYRSYCVVVEQTKASPPKPRT
jgi:hypothetical protein